MDIPWRQFALLPLILVLLACSDDSDDAPPGLDAGVSAVVLEEFAWSQVASGRRWEPRAGLQAIALGERLYIMGGRTPRPPRMPVPVPGDSDIWSDVWASDDGGVSWERILDTGGEHWAARAYFQAVELDGWMYILGGQNFELQELPFCAGQDPAVCPPFVSVSDFFNDVWRSRDGAEWQRMTADAGWAPRAGLSAAVLNGEIYVVAGSQFDDVAIVGGPPQRIYFNDVWKSANGRDWEQVTASAPWEARAGGVLVAKDDYLYLVGGEDGFTCEPLPDCEAPYFNDVWRSQDGANWERMTAAAEWVERPGHQCAAILDELVCFGGFGLIENPVDMWASEDGSSWRQLPQAPWDARSPEDIKYDFDVLFFDQGDSGGPAILTFGGDRETFDFDDPENYLRIDDDVWRFEP